MENNVYLCSVKMMKYNGYKNIYPSDNTSTAYDVQSRILQGGRQDQHITADDRIVYDIYDERITVLVIQAESHYNDK